VLVPVQTEFLAMHGLTHMLRSLDQARREFPGCGELLGVLATMHDDREGIMTEVMADLQRNLGDALFETVIVRDPLLIEAASHGRTLFDYAMSAKGARSYGELVREVVHGREASR
jgi:chromosome partitioning protein